MCYVHPHPPPAPSYPPPPLPGSFSPWSLNPVTASGPLHRLFPLSHLNEGLFLSTEILVEDMSLSYKLRHCHYDTHSQSLPQHLFAATSACHPRGAPRSGPVCASHCSSTGSEPSGSFHGIPRAGRKPWFPQSHLPGNRVPCCSCRFSGSSHGCRAGGLAVFEAALKSRV